MNYTQLLHDLKIQEGPLPSLQDYMKALVASLPHFQALKVNDDLETYSALAKDWRTRFKDIIILGTGGSSLSGQAFYALVDNPNPRLHFLDNIDPHTFEQLLPRLNPDMTGVIAISKSGNTSETLAQLLYILPFFKTPKDHIVVVTEPKPNGIREIADQLDLKLIDHPLHIGGRYAAFTVVGMLPALLMGLDPQTIRRAAIKVLDNCVEDPASPPLVGAIVQAENIERGYTQSVLMPYIDRLAIFGLWFRQLWAESLGKQGKGSTPIRAMGTVDQHSQLQLYLEGPNDKLYTVITLQHQESKYLQAPSFNHDAVRIFNGKTMGQLMMAEQRATIDTLKRHMRPLRVLELNACTPEILAQLMMHFIIETIATAHLIGVNPFDQPAVEEGKVLTRQYLEEF